MGLCTNEDCKHPKKDHHENQGGRGSGCYYAENQGWQEDLCACQGFNIPYNEDDSYVGSLMKKAGI